MKDFTMHRFYWRAAAAMLIAGAAGAAAAQDFPARQVRILVPYGPGTGIDLAARVVAERLSRDSGQPFVVENRTGAGGTIAAAAVAAAAADGYTLLANASAQTSLPALYKNLPFDGRRDFVGVAILGTSPLVLVTSKAKGWTKVMDLVDAGKSKPGALSFASAGVGTTTHLSAEKFRMAAGFQALHVPYKSTTDALTEVMTGRIDFLITTVPSAIGPVKEGRLVALATGMRRAPALPDVPTLAEAGVRGAESDTWFGIFAPSKTPRDVVAKLHADIHKATAAPEVRERLVRMGTDPAAMGLDEIDAMLKREFVENEQLIKAVGVKLE
jgi:tripartite-type tricarboxylate transporter receptor subunit TctC